MTMRVLLTGGTGFFGSHLARAMISRGDELCLVTRRASSLARLGELVERVERVLVSDGEDAAFARGTFDVVVHSATCYGKHGESEGDIRWSNVDWPSRLLAAAAANGVRLFVNIDTSLPPALTPYAHTKRRFAEHAREVARAGDIAVLNVRLESVYGPNDDVSKFNTQLLHAMLADVATFPLTPGEQCRDFIFVGDAVQAFMLLLDHALERNEPYLNAGVGRGEPVSIRTLAQTMRRLAGAHTRLDFGALPYREGELMVARADVGLLRTLGWQGARDLVAGLSETIARERMLLAGVGA
jgi:CDP-paratose synthetase